MKNMDIETKVRQAYEHATPDVLSSVLSDCREQKGTVIIMKERKVNWTRKIGAVAAALALVVGLGAGAVFYRNDRAVAASVSLDVNPSVELLVNRKDRILEVNANNEDGKKILGNMDLTGSDLEVAVNAIVGSMVRSGYLNEAANSVLVSVDSKDAQAGSQLQEKLAQVISLSLEGDAFSGAVISQRVESSNALQAKADEYDISLGKASLIDQITAQDSRYRFEDLAALSINELKLISQSSSVELEHANQVGTASEKGYIGREAALQAAVNQLQASPEDISYKEIEMDFDDGVMVYEVEFILDGYEYDIEVDAKSGAVLTGMDRQENNSNPDAPAVTVPSGNTSSGTSENHIGKDKAKQVAFDHAGVKSSDAKNVKCELDRDDGTVHYDVDFDANGYEYDYEINAATGKVLKSEKERSDDAPAKTAASSDTEELIGKDKAKQVAFDHAGVKSSDAKNVKCELDRDDGTVHYDVDFDANGYEYDYEINAATGKVLKSEKERSDDAPAKTAASSDTEELIGKDKAKQVAFDHAGVKATDAKNVKCELDRDDGTTRYEIEFVANGLEYEYEINAATGKVLKAEKERLGD